MFQEVIAKRTADHLRGHIEVLLERINDQSPGEAANLIVPKSIEVASVVGGLFTTYNEILPQYGIDITGKVISPSQESLYSYLYTGQINGLVHASSQAAVDKLVHRHGAAVELFIREHQFLHQTPALSAADPYTIIEFLYEDTQWSGAQDLGEVQGAQMWLAGFSVDCVWLVSEDGPGQHA